MDKTIYSIKRALAATVIVLAIGSGQRLCAQTPVNISDYRPLVSLLDTLETKAGIPINYEDVPYENAADLEDVSTPQQRAEYSGYHLFVPRKGQISASLDFQSGNAYNLNLALQSYRSNNNPGDFMVEQANGMYYVVATKTLAATGSTSDVVSPRCLRLPVRRFSCLAFPLSLRTWLALALRKRRLGMCWRCFSRSLVRRRSRIVCYLIPILHPAI